MSRWETEVLCLSRRNVLSDLKISSLRDFLSIAAQVVSRPCSSPPGCGGESPAPDGSWITNCSVSRTRSWSVWSFLRMIHVWGGKKGMERTRCGGVEILAACVCVGAGSIMASHASFWGYLCNWCGSAADDDEDDADVISALCLHTHTRALMMPRAARRLVHLVLFCPLSKGLQVLSVCERQGHVTRCGCVVVRVHCSACVSNHLCAWAAHSRLILRNSNVCKIAEARQKVKGINTIYDI